MKWRQKILIGSVLLLGSGFFSVVQAAEITLQQVLHNITVGGDSSVDASFGVTDDGVADAQDSYWEQATGGSSSSSIVVELAGYAGINKFGIFDMADPGLRVELFSGSSGSGDESTFSIETDGSIVLESIDTGVDFSGYNFGFYLDSSLGGGGGLFYSDTSLNTDTIDHMRAYQGVGDIVQIGGSPERPWSDVDYVLGWEDLVGGGDFDYQDFVVMFSSIAPPGLGVTAPPASVPEPSTTSILVVGTLGYFGIVKLKKISLREVGSKRWVLKL